MRNIQILIWAVALCLVPIAVSGQGNDADRQLMKLRNASARHAQLGQPLAALVAMEKVVAKTTIASDLHELATLRSIVGDGRGALLARDQKDSLFEHPENKIEWPHDLTPQDAIDAIVQAARNRQIVILNEDHTTPMHRGFAIQLASRLRNEGFSYLAAETFGVGMKQLEERKYALRSNGYYTNEPVFGNFIRESMRIGFKPIAYDAMPFFFSGDMIDRINTRESAACRNLVSQTFAKDPKARVFVYVGSGHVSETANALPDGREEIWLAARLAQATGMDPLTIDQTTQSARSKQALTTPEWSKVSEKGWFGAAHDLPVVLKKSDGSFWVGGGFHGRVDMQVFHPPTTFVSGRPNWLANDRLANDRLAHDNLAKHSKRKPIPIPDAIKPDDAKGGRLLVQAFVESESELAIPIDQVLLETTNERPALLLPPGRYRIVVQNENGEEVIRMPLEVKQ